MPTNVRDRPLEFIVDAMVEALLDGAGITQVPEHHFTAGTLVELLPECRLALLAVNVATPGTG